MFCTQRRGLGLIWLPLGLAAGLVIAALAPHTPMHASSTDKVESFGIATGAVNGMSEAVYFLDYLTGDLNAIVVGRHPRTQAFMLTGHYYCNVFKDLKIDAAKSPKFLMVTGVADLTRGGRGTSIVPSQAVLYVAEVSSGRAAAYAIPYNSTAHDQGQFVEADLKGILAFPFRKAGGAPAAKGVEEEK